MTRSKSAVASLLIAAFAAVLSHADTAATTNPTTAPVAIDWSDAAKHVNETVTVTGPVVGVHVSSKGKTASLNVGKDYPATDRFTIFVKMADPSKAADTFKGKTVTVTGKIVMYKSAAEVVADEADVKIAK